MLITNHIFRATISTGNDAFSQDMEGEIQRICNNIEQKIKEGQTKGVCIDLNGNTVGTWKKKKNNR